MHAGYIMATKEFKKSQSSEALWEADAENCITGASRVAEPNWIVAGGQQNWAIGLKMSQSMEPSCRVIGSLRWGTGPGPDRWVNRQVDRWLDGQLATQSGPWQTIGTQLRWRGLWLSCTEAPGIAGSSLSGSPLKCSQGALWVGSYHFIVRYPSFCGVQGSMLYFCWSVVFNKFLGLILCIKFLFHHVLTFITCVDKYCLLI